MTMSDDVAVLQKLTSDGKQCPSKTPSREILHTIVNGLLASRTCHPSSRYGPALDPCSVRGALEKTYILAADTAAARDSPPAGRPDSAAPYQAAAATKSRITSANISRFMYPTTLLAAKG